MIKVSHDKEGIHIDLDFYVANAFANGSIAAGRTGCQKALEESNDLFKSQYQLYLDEINEFIQKLQNEVDEYIKDN